LVLLTGKPLAISLLLREENIHIKPEKGSVL